jgi:hypothetical protein
VNGSGNRLLIAPLLLADLLDCLDKSGPDEPPRHYNLVITFLDRLMQLQISRQDKGPVTVHGQEILLQRLTSTYGQRFIYQHTTNAATAALQISLDEER